MGRQVGTSACRASSPEPEDPRGPSDARGALRVTLAHERVPRMATKGLLMKLRTWWLAAVLSALALLVAACADDTADEPEEDVDEVEDVDETDLGLEEEGLIIAGSDIDFEPFEFIEDGVEVGFDIDLMNEIADRLGVDVEFVNTGFDTIITQLDAGEFDVIISAITITEERAETINFSDPYFAANQALVVQVDSGIDGVDDLDGLDIGVQAATTGADYAQENFAPEGATIVEFPGTPEAFTALEADQIDGVFIDLPVASANSADRDSIELVAEVDTDEEYGIGVNKDNEGLLAAINAALADIIADGTYAEIYGTWFEGDVPQQFQ